MTVAKAINSEINRASADRFIVSCRDENFVEVKGEEYLTWTSETGRESSGRSYWN